MKKRLILSCTSLILALVFSVTVAYAWFTSNSSANNIIVTTGEMKVGAELYLAKDFDLDGNLDLDDKGEAILVQQLVTEPITIKGLLPGQVRTYVLKVENTGTISGTVSVNLLGISGDLRDIISINGKSSYQKESVAEVVSNSSVVLKSKEIMYVALKIKCETLDYLKVNTNLGVTDDINNPFISNGFQEINKYQQKSMEIKQIELVLTQVVQ